MLETLINLKNNKLKKAGNAGQTGGTEAVERMKKFLSGLSKKKHGWFSLWSFFPVDLTYLLSNPVLAHEPLRVSLSDLHSAESKGKWWLVGAAWGGDPLVDRRQAETQQALTATEDVAESALLKLARKQGMNTDIRRSVFVVLMSSDVSDQWFPFVRM
jgi:nucleolar MIF4G domain-containing protein 1